MKSTASAPTTSCRNRRIWRQTSRALFAGLAVVLLGSQAHAQLRIANYNVLNNPDNASEDDLMRAVFQGIANQSVGGVAKPIDVITLHEIDTAGTQRIPGLLQQVNPSGNYQIAFTEAVGGDRNAIVYNANSVQLVGTGMTTLDNPSGPRDILRAQFRPAGYSSTGADFYLYAMHLKADTSSAGVRNAEASYVRANSDALGSANAIYAGDFNFYGTSESGYQTLRSAGAGQAFDPVLDLNYRLPGSSDVTYPSSGRRFDYQFVTGELADAEGLDMIPGSYRVYPADSGSSLSDHLPIVADYQLPAVMDAELAPYDLTYQLNDPAEAVLSVENIAQVLAAAGADELDYTISVTGDLLGSYSGSALALDDADLYSIGFDTSTPGLKSGTIFVQANSFAAEHASFEFPVSFTVVAVPEPASLTLLLLGAAALLRRRSPLTT